jgi:hypothetical protein
MGSNDVILNEGGRIKDVFWGDTLWTWDALGHSFGTPRRGPAGQRQSRSLDLYV